MRGIKKGPRQAQSPIRLSHQSLRLVLAVLNCLSWVYFITSNLDEVLSWYSK